MNRQQSSKFDALQAACYNPGPKLSRTETIGMNETQVLERGSEVQQQNPHKLHLLKKIQEKTIRVGVVGLGYVGLPFLVEKAKVDLNVVGIDRSQERVDHLLKGTSYIGDVSDADLKNILAKGLVEASTSFDVVETLDVIVICVPTPIDKNFCPDLSHVVAVSEKIAEHLKPGQLVSLESTTYPGTTEEVIQPILEKSGLIAGRDFFLTHSPERVDPGNKRYTTKNTNKIVGGIDQNSLDVGMAFYGLAIDHVVPVSDAKTAEMIKVYENTYRAVNIALANEMAMLCDRMGINVWEMLEAAFTKPFGIMPFYPGPGVGGHCIPVDPHYLEWKAREYNFQTRFIALASETNLKMPHFVFHKAARLLNQQKKSINGSKILMIGLAYKPDVSDFRESPALSIHELLSNAGAQVMYHDPYVPTFIENGHAYLSIALTDELLEATDLVLITTNHSCVDFNHVIAKSKLILDTRNATGLNHPENVVLL
jgi:UDP-N-acetyl-D-glucosamine dehydrogenase